MIGFPRVVTALALALAQGLAAQQWVAEWFIDVDPGAGAANITTFDRSNPDFQLSISTEGIAPGTHILGFRIADNKYKEGLIDHKHWWSTTEIRSIYVLPKIDPRETLLGSFPITGGEWFVGKDPGTGDGNPLSWARTDSVHDWYGLSFSNLPEGLNTVGVRVQDSVGRWSATKFRTFLVVEGRSIQFDASAPLVGGEWFVGKDPGAGKGNPLSWARTDSVHDWYGLSFSNLPEGLNTVGARVQDSVGRWSATKFRTFLVVAGRSIQFDASAPLVGGEWFVGKDPGAGKGQRFGFPKTDSLHAWHGIDFKSLPLGLNTLGVRVQDSVGRWSATHFRTFLVVAGITPTGDTAAPLVGGEWFFDRDPGTGRGTSFTFDPSDSLSMRLAMAAKGLPLGAHRVGIRIRDALGRWSGTRTGAFLLVQGPSARDTVLTSLEDSTARFGPFVFPWRSDSAVDTLQQVVIHTLPSRGSLAVDGMRVSAGDRIGVDRLRRGELVYRPANNAHGQPLDTVRFAVIVDSLVSNIAGVRLDVLPVNDAPGDVLAERPDTAWVNQPWVLRWSGVDVDGDSLRLVARGLPAWIKPGPDGRSLVGAPTSSDVSASPVALALWVTDGTDSVVVPAAPIVVAARISTSVDSRAARKTGASPSSFSLVRSIVEEPVDGTRPGEIRRVPKGSLECRGPRFPLAVGDVVDVAIWDRLGVPVLEWSGTDLPSGELWLDWNLHASNGVAVPTGVFVWEIRVKNVRTGDSRREYLLQGVKRP